MPTQQETFDYVLAFMRKQGRPAVNAKGTCVHRTLDGVKCGAGCLIPDEAYDLRMDLRSAPLELNTLARSAIESEGHDISLVSAIQMAHDGTSWNFELNRPAEGAEWLAVFEERMAVVASRFHLTYTPVSA